MEVLFELIFEIFGEVILQIVFEALAEVGIHLIRPKDRQGDAPSVGRLVIGYPLIGAVAGALSLLLFPHSFTHTHPARIATLVLAPFVAAASMVLLGAARARQGQQLVSLDRFAYAYLFALGPGVIRFIFAT